MWYKVKFKYYGAKRDPGKTFSETFLIAAADPADAWQLCQQINANRLDDLDGRAVDAATFRPEFQVGGTHFYQVKLSLPLDGGKAQVFTVLLAADSVADVSVRITKLYDRSTVTPDVLGAVRSPYVAVYDPAADQWISDCRNRMDARAADGYYTIDALHPESEDDSQLDIEFGEGFGRTITDRPTRSRRTFSRTRHRKPTP